MSALIGDGFGATPAVGVAPTWPRADDQRRLLAYRALSAIRDNLRRYWLPPSLWTANLETRPDGSISMAGRAPAEQFREYGHAAALVDSCRALVLGDDQVVAVPAAAETTTGGATTPGDPAAVAVQTWLTGWADRERLRAKLLESEEHSIGDGDSVMVLGWSPQVSRPRLRVMDPGFYFPDWDAAESATYTSWGWDDEEFPPVVHLAWEHEDDQQRTWLRRTTWRLVPSGDPVALPDGRVLLPERDLPWGRSGWTCRYSVTEFDVRRLPAGFDLYTGDLSTRGARPVLAEVDLGIDFIPVVHVPNDEPGARRWGRSLLTRLVQILDDMSGGDTDLATNAELVASPATVTTGVHGLQLEGGPGAHFELPAGGSAAMVDTSRALDALLKYGERLLEHLAVNSRLAQALLGRVSPSDVPSGYALQLGFAPAKALLRELRLVRDDKYPLVLRMAVRLAQQGGALPPGPTPVIRLDLGTALPADQPAAVESVKALLSITPTPPISLSTAVRILQAAGFPIDDAQAEVERIRSTDFAAASLLVDATGVPADAYAHLGREIPDASNVAAPEGAAP